ncbi:hypothetical protein BBAD15_g7996 [Beauveria bassiana D1-5]|uniref:Uncharacterized protein n=1 Tax=Beauveria bassiana D1-5 TaxID=1245745 RepID=A0A0A2W160_BEABA|nr:hypothetical protein BBAD15_g7996 [Beauveria bassiana D1-5]
MAHHPPRRPRPIRRGRHHHHRRSKVCRRADPQPRQVVAHEHHVVCAAVQRHAPSLTGLGFGAPPLKVLQDLGLGGLRSHLRTMREREPGQGVISGAANIRN